MIFTRDIVEKGLEPFCEKIRLCSGDSVEEFEPQKKNLIDFYCLLLKIAEREYFKQNPPKPKEPKRVTPETILESRIEIPDDSKRLIGRETIIISERFEQVLKTRDAATPLADLLRSNIKRNIHTKLNFKGVIYSDASFLDKCIATVLFAAGEEHFNRKVAIVYANKQVRDMIDYVVTSRKDFYLGIYH